MYRFSVIPLALAASVVLPSPGFPHAYLERASPPPGSEIPASPPELAITFTGGIEPLFTTIEVHGADGSAVPLGAAHLAADGNRQLIVALPKLPPGTYTVIWHATSVDTHKTEGNYQFTIIH